MAFAAALGPLQPVIAEEEDDLPSLTLAEMGLPASYGDLSDTTVGADDYPAFQLPFRCGETWEGHSRSNHRPSIYSIDFNRPDDHGDPVVASAGGRVSVSTNSSSGYGRYVVIDHGGGWSTLHAHLADRDVQAGATVTRGQQIGTVGNTSGTRPVGSHLHYEQRYGERVRPAYFNGAAFQYDLQTLTSRNCNTTTLPTNPGLAVASRAVNRLDVFARASNGSIQYKNWNGQTWSGWQSLGGTFISDPAAVATGSGRLDVFAVGTAHDMRQRTWTSAGWGAWQSLGGYLTSSPAVTVRHAGSFDLFSRNSANVVVHRHFSSTTSTWGGWQPLGMVSTSAPAALATGDDRMTVFARDDDGSLLTRLWTQANNGWYSWVDRGGSFVGRPSASSRTSNAVDVFLRAPDGSLRHRHASDGVSYSQEYGLGGYLTTSPAAISWSSGRIDIFSRNSEKTLVHRWWISGADWSSWQGLGAIP